MSGFSADMMRTVDEMIKARRDRVTAVGTVTARPATRTVNTLSVTFDGSTLAVPVKQGANVLARAGDRVGMVKFGNEWVVVVSFTAYDPQEQGYDDASAVGTTTSASYTATPGGEDFAFDKAFTDTRLRMVAHVGAYSSTTFTGVAYGLHLAELSTTYDVASIEIPDANKHVIVSGQSIQSGIAAGSYTVGLRWKRPTGVGTLNMDDNDRVCFGVAEIGP